jgi:hypothetical protein
VVGEEVWCGGTDGVVRIWDSFGKQEGVLNPTWEFAAHIGQSSIISVPRNANMVF